MTAGTEFHIVGAPAGIAKEWFARRHVVAVEAIEHRVHSKDRRASSPALCQMGDQKPFRSIASRVVNQKIWSVILLVASRSHAIRCSDFATTNVRNCCWWDCSSNFPE